jgi:hypothetical protein
VSRGRSGSALQPHWRWRSVALRVGLSVFGTLFALGWVQAVGGIGLGKALSSGLLVARYLAGGQFLDDVI